MRKQIFVSLLLVMLLLGGCAEVSTAPTQNTEPVTETQTVAAKGSTDSIFPSESKQTEAPAESEAPESTEKPEATETPSPAAEEHSTEAQEQRKAATTESSPTPAASEKQPTAETKPAPAQTEKPQETTKPSTETPPPAQTQPPVEEQPQTTPEETKPKSAYDFEFDIEAIKADCIGIGRGMGLSLDSSLTPSNSTWWNPVTASQSNQGTALKQSLESYITFHTAANLSAYGMDEITVFNIYCEARGNGSYSIYFLFA